VHQRLRHVEPPLRGYSGQPECTRHVLAHPVAARSIELVGCGRRIGGHRGQDLLLECRHPGCVPLERDQQINPARV
jgi:hypothetical protein